MSSTASYVDAATYLSLDATVSQGAAPYETNVSGMQDAAYLGRAFGGRPANFPKQGVCFMVGTDQILKVGSASGMSLEDVAARTEEIHDLL